MFIGSLDKDCTAVRVLAILNQKVPTIQSTGEVLRNHAGFNAVVGSQMADEKSRKTSTSTELLYSSQAVSMHTNAAIKLTALTFPLRESAHKLVLPSQGSQVLRLQCC